MIGIIGLGYVGLPLAIEFSRIFKTIGFDIDKNKISNLKRHYDETNEVLESDLQKLIVTDFEKEKSGMIVTENYKFLKQCNYFIITVPTPVDKNNSPDLNPLKSASVMISKILKKGDIVIYESTVFPGATEEICVPILEKNSGLTLNKDFGVGYSPERINPGDKIHTLKNITKVVSGSNKETSIKVKNLYEKVVTAGTHLVSNIKTAEAAKIIENTQRDINIAFINELAKIFSLMDIETSEVLTAAGTKWNFLNFKPGIVGGHCIGVDPYYLAYKVNELGYNPEMILSGRRINNSMPKFIAEEYIKLLIKKDINIRKSKTLILGVTFKENCPDTRNSKVFDIYDSLKEFGLKNIFLYDYLADSEKVFNEYGIRLEKKLKKYDGIIAAVNHEKFRFIDIKKHLSSNKNIVYDLKNIFKSNVDKRL